MGGHEAGEVASAMVVEALGAVEVGHDLDAFAAAAVNTLGQVNSRLIELAKSNGGREGRSIGTTVVGIAAAGAMFRCFWMGDSRAYRMRGGELVRISHDHSLVQTLIDAGMLSEDEAETHENANIITRAVGVSENVEVEVVSGDIQPGDLFLLASDGLTRVVRDPEIATKLRQSPPEEAADTLLELVLARGAPDNVSLIILKVA